MRARSLIPLTRPTLLGCIGDHVDRPPPHDDRILALKRSSSTLKGDGF